METRFSRIFLQAFLVMTVVMLNIAIPPKRAAAEPACSTTVIYEDFEDGDITNDPAWSTTQNRSEIIGGQLHIDGIHNDGSDRYSNTIGMYPFLYESSGYVEFSFLGLLKSVGNPQEGRGIQFTLGEMSGVRSYLLQMQRGYVNGFPTNKYSFSLAEGSNASVSDLIVSSFMPQYDVWYAVRAIRENGIWSLYVDGQLVGSAGDPHELTDFAFIGLSTVGSVVVDDLLVKTCPFNAPPEITGVSGPQGPAALGAGVGMTATFMDPDPEDTHTARWDWGDGTVSDGVVTEAGGAGMITGSHNYSTAGIYSVQVAVEDNAGLVDEAAYDVFVVVYNPDGGFMTGGGWFISPPGAYAADPTLTGEVTFAFNSKYKKDSTTPKGEMTFEFQAAALSFQASGYEWMVVNGDKAQLMGRGTINGQGDYYFFMAVKDGKATNSDDLLRIKIWSDETMVYDTQSSDALTAAPTTAIGGGSIVIHK